MQKRHVTLWWLTPLICTWVALGLMGLWSGCQSQAECVSPNTKVGDQCVEPTVEATNEAPADAAKEAPPEVRRELLVESIGDAAAEPRQEQPPQERLVPDSIVADKAEAVVETPPKEEKTEATPESSGPTPTVSFVSPKEGDVVKGEITIKIDATVAGAAIAEVALLVDGIDLHKWTLPPYEFTYQTTSLKDGPHKLTVIAKTDLGKSQTQEISITTSNSGPIITFVSPVADATVSAAITIEVNVSAAQGIKAGSVMLEVDGAPLAWTQTTPTYKATYDPTSKPYDSIPISVSAEDSQGKQDTQEIWVVHEPPVGPKQVREVCDNTDPLQRCVAGHSCLTIGGATATPTCYKQCAVGGSTSQCPVVFGKQFTCQLAFQGTSRGACVEGPPQPGSLYSPCGTINGANVNCNSGLLCVGAQRRPDGSLISFCLQPCTTPGTSCPGTAGFSCVGLTGGGGACIEMCGQSCTASTDCSKGQTCANGTCSAPFCQNYGACIAIQGLASRVCI